ncbi:MAG: hypothetical protein LJE91_12200 [Gammaproteobacteria bacterium]|nr:hypothetical protein [Gammaproteobacteria bacterium]
MTPDGRNWHIQVRVETRARDWSSFSAQSTTSRYVAYAVCSRREGLSRVPIDATLSVDRVSGAAREMTARVVEACEHRPFPRVDRYALWMLDRERHLPLAMVACSTNRERLGVPRNPRWVASLEGDREFIPGGLPVGPGPAPGGEAIENARRVEDLVERLAGIRPAAAWFERDGHGVGISAAWEGSHRAASMTGAASVPLCFSMDLCKVLNLGLTRLVPYAVIPGI